LAGRRDEGAWQGRILAVTTLACLVWATASQATHGGGGALAVVVEAESATNGTGGRGCVMTGTVVNPNEVTVTVTLTWQAKDPAGSPLGSASARVSRLPPAERRQFVSSPFVAATGVMPGCDRLGRIERVEAAGDAGP
jgi:hypothetical protein